MTDTTPTTPLDLDAAIEAAARAMEDSALSLTGRDLGTIHRDAIATSALTAIGYAELVDEMERLRGARELAEMYRQTLITRGENFDTCADNLAAERDAAIARAERARQWIMTCVDPVTIGPERKQAMLDYLDGKRDVPDDLATLTEVQAGAGASETDPGELCPTCGRTRNDRTASPHNEGFGLCPESFHFRSESVDSEVE